MTNDEKLMQQALDALRLCTALPTWPSITPVIEALHSRLAKPEPEPVAWFTEDHREDKSATTYSKKMAARWQEKGWPVTPLYATPPHREWQGLTDEEITQGLKESWVTEQAFQSVCWWAEEKLKEKNDG